MQWDAYWPLSPLLPLSSSYSKPLLPGFSHCPLSKSTTFFFPHPALSHSRFLFHSPCRSNALHFYDASQFTEPGGIYDLINPTTTFMGRCCPHSADDENEAKRDEVTWSKPRNHIAAEAGVGPCSVLQTSLSVTPTLQIKCLVLHCTELHWIFSLNMDPKWWLLSLGEIFRECQRRICLPESYPEFWGSPILSHWSVLMSEPTAYAQTAFWWNHYCGQK